MPRGNASSSEYIAYIDEQYSSERLAKILYDRLPQMIGAECPARLQAGL